jgi:hypothetical protein
VWFQLGGRSTVVALEVGGEMEERRRWGFMRATGSEISSSKRGGKVGVSATGLFTGLGRAQPARKVAVAVLRVHALLVVVFVLEGVLDVVCD